MFAYLLVHSIVPLLALNGTPDFHFERELFKVTLLTHFKVPLENYHEQNWVLIGIFELHDGSFGDIQHHEAQ